ncbi:Clp protease N-terminal domain-containing protein, partial [Streptomyces sp. NPDC058953]
MTNAQLDIGWKVIGILGAAWGATDTDTMGTEDLLAGISYTKGPARDALAAEAVTMIAVAAILRDRRGGSGATSWTADDDTAHSVSSHEILGEDGDEGRLLTGAAVRAFAHAYELAGSEAAGADSGIGKMLPEHLLRGLLRDGGNRCAEVLALCGTTPDAVRARLDGDVPDAAAAAGGDGAPGTGVPAPRLDPLLLGTRDLLIGRRQYPVNRLRRWLLRGVNWATAPVNWVHHESFEQARALGSQTPGTEHVLLAALATYEVAAAHPHLAREGVTGTNTRQLGGERLAAMGLDYATVRAALAAGPELGTDAKPAEKYLEAAREDHGTGPLVEALLLDGTRAGR